jgi:Cys-tRNA(Pro) deacylase
MATPRPGTKKQIFPGPRVSCLKSAFRPAATRAFVSCPDTLDCLTERMGLHSDTAAPEPTVSADPLMSATDDLSLVDRFCDALWLEDGLARNTIDAYRRDLVLLVDWLHENHQGTLQTVEDAALNGYFASRHAESRASSANRRLAVFRRFYRWALRERLVIADPCLLMRPAKQPPRFPKTLSEAQVEALLNAPDTTTPLGLRDRTMIELMYASGSRMSRKEHISETPATQYLRRQRIVFSEHPYQYEEHGGTTVSARELGVDEHQVVKTLVMQDEAGKPLIVLMHGDCKVSTKNLARQIGCKSVEPCAPDVAQRHSGYQVGGTSPFGTRKTMPVYVEQGILALERIYINGGRRGYLISVAPQVLTAWLGAKPVECALPD